MTAKHPWRVRRFFLGLTVLLCASPISIAAQTASSGGLNAPSKTVSAALSEIFENKTGESIAAAFSSKCASIQNPHDKRQLLFFFADYEERAGYFESAAAHYEAAAGIAPVDYNLCLDAARCFMYVNDSEKAAPLVQRTLLESFEPEVLCRARFYSACIQLSQGDTDGAFSLLRAYTANASFEPFYPQMLFILWYAADDSAAKNRLLSGYPDSIEAALVRGEANVSPQAFWYFMPAGEKRVSSRMGSSASSFGDSTTVAGGTAAAARPSGAAAQPSPAASGASPDPTTNGIWQQTGFFKNRVNAEALAEELSKAGFRVFIRQEKRESGTTYFSVLIPEDESGSTALRLKDKGFESYLVID